MRCGCIGGVILRRPVALACRYSSTTALSCLPEADAKSLPRLRRTRSSSPATTAVLDTYVDSLDTLVHRTLLNRLDTRSTVWRGTGFEVVCLSALRLHGFRVGRCGRAGDGGVDISGEWEIGGRCVRVAVQCKNERAKVGPKYVRELAGQTAALPADAEEASPPDAVLGVLVSRSHYTAAAIDAIKAARDRPLALCVVEPRGELALLIAGGPATHTGGQVGVQAGVLTPYAHAIVQRHVDTAHLTKQPPAVLTQIVWNRAAAVLLGRDLQVRVSRRRRRKSDILTDADHGHDNENGAADVNGEDDTVLRLVYDGKVISRV
ncbi:hypothetical protein PYCC9005_005989 [Savitreella phatthalungensis]